MSSTDPFVRVGRVGRPHGLDGGFHLVEPSERLTAGTPVRIGTLETTVEQLAGTAERPLIRVSGVDTRERAHELRGAPVLVAQSPADLAEGEYFSTDLVGLRVGELGTV